MKTSHPRRPRLSYANVTSTLALVVATTMGGAYAHGQIGSAQLKDDAVKSRHIANGQVKSVDLRALAVGTGKLKDGAVDASKLAAAAVTESHLADGAVVNAKIANGSVNGVKLANGAVVNAKIGNGAVTTAKIANAAVDATKLGDGSVTNAKLGNGAVNNAKLANSSVSHSKLGADVAAARAYGQVFWPGSVQNAKNISNVTHPATGVYCIHLPFTPNVAVASPMLEWNAGRHHVEVYGINQNHGGTSPCSGSQIQIRLYLPGTSTLNDGNFMIAVY